MQVGCLVILAAFLIGGMLMDRRMAVVLPTSLVAVGVIYACGVAWERWADKRKQRRGGGTEGDR